MGRVGVDVVEIRTADTADAAALASFGAQTFRTTYVDEVPAEALEGFIGSVFGVDRQAAELADPACLFLLAEEEQAIVGYALIREVSTPPSGVGGARPLQLDRLYVDPSAHGRGVGRALLQAVLEAARARGHDVLWLTVWERNHRAIEIYRHWGFSDMGAIPFDLAGEAQTDRVLVLDRGQLAGVNARPPRDAAAPHPRDVSRFVARDPQAPATED
jgi:diamine N-acetyltransferase